VVEDETSGKSLDAEKGTGKIHTLTFFNLQRSQAFGTLLRDAEASKSCILLGMVGDMSDDGGLMESRDG